MAFSLADICERKLKILNSKKLPSKLEFGRKMHDPDVSEEEKMRELEKVIMAGGYDGLPDE